jgi:hypothetical protein
MGGDDSGTRGDPHQDELLDEAIEESFPASDPPSSNGSVTPPGHRPRPTPDDKEA